MAINEVIGITIKGISDFSDVVSNVGTVQKALMKLKIPDKLGESLNKNISNFTKEYDKYQKKIAEGIHTQGDQNAVNKSLNSMINSYEKIIKDFSKISEKDFKEIFNLDEGAFASVQKRIREIQVELKKVKLDPKQLTEPFAEISQWTKASAVIGEGKGLNKIRIGFEENDLNIAKEGLAEIDRYLESFKNRMKPEKYAAIKDIIEPVRQQISNADEASQKFRNSLDSAEKEMRELGTAGTRELQNTSQKLKDTQKAAESVTEELKRQHSEEFSFNRQVQDIDRQIQSYFGLSQIIRKVGDIARDSFETVKELDAAMTETAVVTNFSVGDMWEMLPTYTEQANQLGTTIKDVYEAATLYYQQGLNTNQAMGLANETLKMARIAGLGAAEATDMMTAALRGFNMEINQTSAQKINDIYSELAAITASDTKEIGSAMERTASIANSANMDFATTSAFLAQMIETTREAPENLGTAMKTIVARFQEMKQDPTKLVDSEGVAMDANKVDKALKTIGVNLLNTKGEFRDLDDVFLDISAKWDSLTQGQQRYIATIAAGSRQQSRFIAMMSDYDRTMELVDAANNSAGASQKQFEKTLDSMSTKLNQLKNAWNQFTMGLVNNQIIKFGIDALTDVFTVVNKVIDVLSKIPPSPFEGVTKSILTLVSTLTLLDIGKRVTKGGILAGAGWIKNEGKFIDNFRSGLGIPSKQDKAQQEEEIESKVQQTVNKPIQAKVPVSVDTYLQKIDASTLDEEVKARIREELGDDVVTAEKQAKVNTILAGHGASEDLFLTKETIEQINNGGKEVENLDKKFTGLQNKISVAGSKMQVFGSMLQNTPLAPLGSALVGIGTALELFAGSTIAATFAEKGFVAGLREMTVAALESPLFPFIAAIISLTALFFTLDKAIESPTEKLERMSDASAKAADAFDSAKQETSELADSIKQIKDSDNVFDNLVAGTAEFNQQLIETNQKITELINKYPMLNDPKYLSTDSNGLMHISEEGLKAVQEEQKRRQSNAAALSTLQNAQLTREENLQKARKLAADPNPFKKETEEERNKRLQQAEYLKESAEAAEKVAQATAISSLLSGEEIKNREKITAIYSNQYDDLVKQVDTTKMGIEEMRQAYADFYGYTYNSSTKKMTDVEGNVVMTKEDDQIVRDAIPDIVVSTNLQLNGASLDSMLSTIDREFSKSLGNTFQNAGDIFSDVMSNEIETDEDALQKLLENPEQIADAISQLEDAQVAAILQVSEEEVKKDRASFDEQLKNQFIENGQNIAAAQVQAYTDLAGMIAQSTGLQAKDFLGKGEEQQSNRKEIEEAIDKLSQEQKLTMASVGTALRDNVGPEAMTTFINKATEIYSKNDKKTITEFNNLLEGVNWESSISRLSAFKEMTEANSKSIQKMGQDLLNSTESINIVTDAFTEFYNSSDFEELSKNMDNFVDSTGKLNAASVEEMSKECGTLKELLDTDAISAGGVAAALNAMGKDGKITVMDLNDSLLEFLSTANQLDDVLSSAHNIIENFDWGVDTGESKDFVVDASKQWKELYEGGEFGNQQLENYAKFVLGQERWEKELKSHDGNIEKALDSMSKDILKYSDGFKQAWIDMANSTDKKYKDFTIDENGDLNWDTNGKSTEQLVKWLADTRHVTEDFAKLMVEDFANYSYDFKTELAQNDFNAALKNGNFINERTGAEGLTLTSGEIRTLAEATGRSRKEIKEAIAEAAGVPLKELNKSIIKTTDKEGNLLMEDAQIERINKQFSKSVFGENTNKSWVSQYKAKDEEGKTRGIEIKDAIAGAVSEGINEEQATKMAWMEAKKLAEENKKVFYNGQELTKEQLADPQAFTEAIQEITDTSQWVTVGQTIGEQMVSALRSAGILPEEEETSTGQEKDSLGKIPEDAGIHQIIKWWNGLFENPQGKTENTQTDSTENKKDTQKEKTGNLPEEAGIHQIIKWWEGFAKESSEKTKSNKNNPTLDSQSIQTEEVGEKTNEASKTIKNAWEAFKKALTSSEVNPKQVEKATKGKTKKAGKAAADGAAEGIEAGANEAAPDSKGKGKKAVERKAKKAIENNIEEGTVAGAEAANPKQKKTKTPSNTSQKQPQEKTVTITSEVKNEEAIDNLNKKLKKIPEEKKSTITVTQKYKTEGKKVKAKDQKANVSYDLGKQANPDDKKAKVNYTLGKQAAPKPKETTVDYNMGTQADPKSRSITLWATIKDKKSGKTISAAKLSDSGATGINNKIPYSSSPQFGSLAAGTRYGRVGPKGKGGLTLTGEKGFEIAWLPSESRSMILGADGPQMLKLPSDAVVYTHEQSKKIIKQKSIPAGSHAGMHLNTGSSDTSTSSGGDGGNSTGKGGSGNGDKNSKGVNKAVKTFTRWVTKAGQVSVWWENIARVMDDAQRDAEKTQNKLKKLLDTFGATLGNYKEVQNTYVEQQKRVIATAERELEKVGKEIDTIANGTTRQQKARAGLDEAKAQQREAKKTKTKKDDKEAAKAVKKANKEVKAANKAANKKETGSAVQISWEIKQQKKKGKKGKWKSTKKKKTKKQIVDLSKFIYEDENGVLQIDQAELDKIAGSRKKGGKAKAEAIKDAAEKEINDRISKQNAAEDAAEKAQEAIIQDYNDAYKAFNQWNKSITKLYLLGLEVEKLGNLRSAFESVTDLEFAKLEAGFSSAIESVPKIQEAFKKNIDILVSTAQLNTEKAVAAQEELDAILDPRTHIESYMKFADSTDALADFESMRKALEILGNEGEGAFTNGRFDYNKASASLEKLYKEEYNAESYNKIKEAIDKLAEKQNEVTNAVAEANQSRTELYTLLEDYQSQMADFEDSLISGIEEQANKEIDRLNKLNSSLTDAAKDLIDEVKRKLDERRKQEDNAKTENEISRKQQRLAMLRADTAGGHAVEIAQLEKEIADAQQSYGRTLEDQLLDKLQQQNDEAAKQRERQIELLEAQRDLAEALGTNVAEVNEWLKDPERYEEQIKAAWMANKNFEESGLFTQQQISEEWEKTWANIQALMGQEGAIYKLTEILSGDTLSDSYTTGAKDISDSLSSMDKTLTDILNKLDSGLEFKTSDDFTIQDYKNHGYNAAKVREIYSLLGKELSAKDILEHYSLEEVLNSGAFNIGELTKQGYSLKTVLKKLLLDEKVPLENIYKIIETFDSTHSSAARKMLANMKFLAPYATGGLATRTGPAWLDGTPTKPELVLNAQDTKNFIALKDVLSHAVNSAGSTSQENAVYDIDINVDHISSDYDVDKIAKRVQNIIVEKSSYRNVTQVRSFR